MNYIKFIKKQDAYINAFRNSALDSYFNNNKAKDLKALKGEEYRQAGIDGENQYVNFLGIIHLDVEHMEINHPVYDAIVMYKNKKHFVQIKTDVTGDGKFPRPTKKQKEALIQIAIQNGGVPVVVNNTLNHPEKHVAKNLLTDEEFIYEEQSGYVESADGIGRYNGKITMRF
jgi:hypothetical protein